MWGEAMAGGLLHWLTNPEETLAYILLTDQMSRNMFRGTWRAYSSDQLARAASHIALSAAGTCASTNPQRQFFYLPLEHSESLADQERAVRLMALRLTAPRTCCMRRRIAKSSAALVASPSATRISQGREPRPKRPSWPQAAMARSSTR